MKIDAFELLVEKRFEECRTVLLSKSKEYSAKDDKLSNFRQAGALKGETAEKALWGMWAKHIISLRKIIEDIDSGVIPSEGLLSEKCGDMINYTLLLEALIIDRMEKDVIMRGLSSV
jgi:hypothetical protein